MITGTYNLTVNPQWINVQQQEVFLECDTTLAPVTINLFEIAELNRFWGVKIIISDANNNAGTNNITINASGGSAPLVYGANSLPYGTSNVLTGLGPGTYVVHTKDAKKFHQCQFSALQSLRFRLFKKGFFMNANCF